MPDARLAELEGATAVETIDQLINAAARSIVGGSMPLEEVREFLRELVASDPFLYSLAARLHLSHGENRS